MTQGGGPAHGPAPRFLAVLTLVPLLAWAAHGADALRAADTSAASTEKVFAHPLRPGDDIPEGLIPVLESHREQGVLIRYEEEKRIAILQRPLRSSGELILLPGLGLLKKMALPFPQEVLITETAIVQKDAEGVVSRHALAGEPASKAFVRSFLAVFSGSWESLHRHYRVFYMLESGRWRLGLKPRRKEMKKLVVAIVLEGASRTLTDLWVHEANGDVTHDHFMDAEFLSPDRLQRCQSGLAWAQ